MKMLIVAATRLEIGPLLDYFGFPEGEIMRSPHVDVLITGVGMTATAFALGKYLNSDYSLVLNLGIAGSFERDIALGALVNITEDTFAELGAEDGDAFLSIDELGFGRGQEVPIMGPYQKFLTEIPSVKGITVNTVHGNQAAIDRISNRLSPQVESMEGAAVIYAANQLQVPCIQVRSISNYVERRNRDNWKIGLAIKQLNDWAIAFVGALNP